MLRNGNKENRTLITGTQNQYSTIKLCSNSKLKIKKEAKGRKTQIKLNAILPLNG